MTLDHPVAPLAEDVTTAETMFDPELTYYADRTRVVMRWTGGEKHGVTFGMSTTLGPYQYQAVRFDDGASSSSPRMSSTGKPTPSGSREVTTGATEFGTLGAPRACSPPPDPAGRRPEPAPRDSSRDDRRTL